MTGGRSSSSGLCRKCRVPATSQFHTLRSGLNSRRKFQRPGGPKRAQSLHWFQCVPTQRRTAMKLKYWLAASTALISATAIAAGNPAYTTKGAKSQDGSAQAQPQQNMDAETVK